jgi:hypothetical protein
MWEQLVVRLARTCTHYEVLRRGQQINPVNLRVANGRNLAGRALDLFQIERQRIDTLREVRANETLQEASLPAGRSR